MDPCHPGEGSSTHGTRATPREGHSRATGDGHAWQDAHWDYRKAAAPGIPALGATLAGGRDSREADMQIRSLLGRWPAAKSVHLGNKSRQLSLPEDTANLTEGTFTQKPITENLRFPWS